MAAKHESRFSISVDVDNLSQAWELVIRQLESRCNVNLSDQDGVTCTQLIDQIQTPKGGAADAKQTRATFKRILKYVDVCAAVICTAGSVVFAPSTQIYNAISFVIKVCQKTADVFDTISGLMDKLRAFLEVLSAYLEQKTEKEKMEKGLRTSIFLALEQFIKIIAETYSLTQSWWRGTMKVAFHISVFNGYPAIRTAMDEFDQLVVQITRQQITQIDLKMNKIGRHAAAMLNQLETIDQRSERIEAGMDEFNLGRNEWHARQRIKLALGIDNDKELNHIHRHNENRPLPGTGGWLFQHTCYRDWTFYRESELLLTNVLEIHGPTGYGKSYLSHAVIETLHRRAYFLRQQGVKMRVAWYYFNETPTRTSLEQAMHNIIWQLAKEDQAYMNFLSAWENERYSTDDVDIFKQVLVDFSSKKRPSTVFFIVLDGVDHAGSDSIETLRALIEAVFSCSMRTSTVNAYEALRVQLLLTGNQTFFNKLHQGFTPLGGKIPSIPYIDLQAAVLPELHGSTQSLAAEVLQQADIKAYIKHRLDDSKVFQKNQHPSLELEVIERLSIRAQGNYIPLDSQLSAIERYEDAPRVQLALDEIDGGHADFITEEIEAFNEGRSAQYAKQINTLLIWISVAQHLDTRILPLIIAMKFDRNGLAEPIEYLKKHCSQLLEFAESPDSTTLVSFKPDAEQKLQSRKSVRTKLDSIEIQMVEDLLKATLQRTFGNDRVHERFEFEQFFNAKRAVYSDMLHLHSNAADNALVVLETCLSILCDTSDLEESSALRDFANSTFESHLAQANVISREDSVKKDIGRKLYKVLHGEHIIDAWTLPKDRFWTMLDWLDDKSDICPAFKAVLFDPTVRLDIKASRPNVAWLYDSGIELKSAHYVLQAVAKRVLQQWYNGKHHKGRTILEWLRKYFRKATEHGQPFRSLDQTSSSSADEMVAWEAWAKAELGDMVDNAQWHLRMGAALYAFARMSRGPRLRNLRNRAYTRCENALDGDARLWKATILKATIAQDLSRFTECLTLLQPLAQPLFTPQVHASDYEQALWTAILPNIADCHMRLRQFDKAADCYYKLLSYEYDKPDFVGLMDLYICSLMRALREQDKLGEAFELLQMFSKDGNGDRSTLSRMLGRINSHIHGHIIALTNGDRLEAMTEHYTVAIKSAHAHTAAFKERMRFMKSRLQWYYGTTQDQLKVLQQWETLVQSGTLNLWYRPYRREVLKQLAQGYFILATAPDLDPATRDEYISLLETLDIKASHLIDQIVPPITLLHARIRFLTGDKYRARKLLQTSVRRAIQLIRQDNGSMDGLYMLALILPVLDDEVNAAAAWSKLGPVEREALDEEGLLLLRSSSGTRESPLMPPAKSDSFQSVNGAASHNGQQQDKQQSQDISEWDLEDVIHMSCDGRCGHRWKYADKLWLCLDCFDVQLDTHCYNKLQAGTLDVDICNKDHRHFVVPAFDIAAWTAYQKDTILVGGKHVNLQQWLIALEDKWELDKWNIASQAVLRIQKIWLKRSGRRQSLVATSPIRNAA